MGAFLLAIAAKLLGPRLIAVAGKLPWRLIGIVAAVITLVAAGFAARSWHDGQIADLKKSSYAAGWGARDAQFRAAQDRADAAAAARQAMVKTAGASLNKETTDAFDAATDDVDVRAAAFRLRHDQVAAAAASARRAGAVPGAARATGQADGAAGCPELPDAGVSEDWGLSFFDELAIRTDAERLGVQLDALQAWERDRLKIEQDAAAAAELPQ